MTKEDVINILKDLQEKTKEIKPLDKYSWELKTGMRLSNSLFNTSIEEKIFELEKGEK